MDRKSFAFFNFSTALFALFSLVLLVSPLCTEASTTDEIIRQVQTTYENAQEISSEFIQKVKIAALEREIEKKGKASFKKPGKLRVEYEGDEGRLYLSDSKKFWVYDKGDTQVNVYPVNSQTLPDEALAFLGGLGNLHVQFQVSGLTKAQKKETSPNSQLDWLALKPKNPESNLEEMILGFDRSSHTVSEAFLKNETGNLSHYFFQNVRLNPGLEESLFVFQKPKGVKEIKN